MVSAVICSGVAYIFNYSDSTWTEIDDLSSATCSAGDRFGYSVDISGDKAIVGAYYFDGVSTTDEGTAFTFHDNDSVWTEYPRLASSERASDDWFGYSVAIDGDYAIVGAYQDDDNGSESGAAFIFMWNGSAWGTGAIPAEENEKILASNGVEGDYFGISVSLNGNHAIVGATGNSSAYIYTRDEEAWTETIIRPDNIGVSDLYGISVDISGKKAVIGADYDDDKGSDAGAAYVFVQTIKGWEIEDKLLGSDSTDNDNFGYAVAIDGNYAAIGSYLHNSSTGAVYVFERKIRKK